jgi:hypothetical protein
MSETTGHTAWTRLHRDGAWEHQDGSACLLGPGLPLGRWVQAPNPLRGPHGTVRAAFTLDPDASVQMQLESKRPASAAEDTEEG